MKVVGTYDQVLLFNTEEDPQENAPPLTRADAEEILAEMKEESAKEFDQPQATHVTFNMYDDFLFFYDTQSKRIAGINLYNNSGSFSTEEEFIDFLLGENT